MTDTKLWGDNSVNIQGSSGSCAQHFLSLQSIYKPSFISIPIVLFKLRLGQATLMTNG